MRRIIPAYAGSTSGKSTAHPSPADHPRIRGEHLRDTPTEDVNTGSSPHTRGAPDRGEARQSRNGIIPAYAGSTVASGSRSQPRADHPRIRGEHWLSAPSSARSAGSSPHTRGALLEIPAIPRIAAVIIPVFLYPSPTPQEEADRSMVLLTLS